MFSRIAQANMQAMMRGALIREGQDAFYERKAIALIFDKRRCSGTELTVHLCGKRTPSRLLAHHISNGYVMVEVIGRTHYYTIKPGLTQEDFGL